ncbi:23S rRNA (adenine(2503)-C(2))-methyltransferase RlmN [Halobacteriovorax sp. HLS]|uniref:23S rRNA (adenine(2503)-C(2))-methyltransferase RlmN n=1 Tax=Halobacteriovorax sp. HLS TaxID=2234000 RepID=UPI0013E3E631|nr:23S rRNA (adenine(2503)-C(2))-methyltransferase RlmN [Halobacteriovorax sp. HLS]
MNAQKKSLYSLTIDELRTYLKDSGLAKFAADQVYNWIFKKYQFDMDKWTNVSSKVKENLLENFDTSLPKIVWNGLSSDGTRKFLVGMSDSNTVEAVAIPAKNNRLTLCVSSQIGCAIGCTFCHTGTMGLTRHLTTGEIVGQYTAVTKWLRDNVDEEARLTNIVYMGQGEPLHNFENVKQATKVFMQDQGIGLGQRKITLSTSGLVPQIEKLQDFPPVNVAISLHAAHNNIRTELMPINKAYDLERLFGAIKKIPLKAHRYITYEYILISELNDRPEDIEGLCDLLDKKVSKVNLIPFNEYPESRFKRPSDKQIEWFQNELMRRGYICTTRITKGNDILAACGQLKSEHDKLNLWD